MHVEGSEELAVAADAQLLASGDSVVDGLAGELLHLDVVELPEVAEPLDQLGGYAAVELEGEMRGGRVRAAELSKSKRHSEWISMGIGCIGKAAMSNLY